MTIQPTRNGVTMQRELVAWLNEKVRVGDKHSMPSQGGIYCQITGKMLARVHTKIQPLVMG